MDSFTERMKERARLRREKLELLKMDRMEWTDDPPSKPKLPLQAHTTSNIGLLKEKKCAQQQKQNVCMVSSNAESILKENKYAQQEKPNVCMASSNAESVLKENKYAQQVKQNACTGSSNAESIIKENKCAPQGKQNVWDQGMLKALESQGFSRSNSQSKLVYKFEADRAKKENTPSPSKSPRTSTSRTPYTRYKPSPKKTPDTKLPRNDLPSYKSPGNSPRMGICALKETAVLKKAAIFESNLKSSPSKPAKDPAELSLAERKALFEKNKGEAILPRVAFATSLPAKMRNETKSPVRKNIPESSAGIVKRAISSITAEPQKEAPASKTEKVVTGNIVSRFEKNQYAAQNAKNVELSKDMVETKIPSKITPQKTLEKSTKVEKEVTPVPKPPPMPAVYNDSPEILKTVKDVKPIHVSPVVKPGKLYPSLSDIDNSEGSDRQSTDESFNESKSSEIYLNMSFGDIIEATKNTPLTPPTDQSFSKSKEGRVLTQMDELLEEALGDISSNDDDIDDDTPSPPKMLKSTSFEYRHNKNPIPTTPLVHTVSFYRKQQQNSANLSTPVAVIKREEKSPEKVEPDETALVQEKINDLFKEINMQQTIISQASQALNLCLSTVEFSGSGEQVEGERLLLLASHKRQACLNEIQRLKVENSIRPHGSNSQLTERGDVTITNITIPFKREAIHSMAAEESMQYLVCLVKSDEKVLATPAISATREHLMNMALCIPGHIKLEKLSSDFKVTVEVYNLALSKEMLPHEIKYHISSKKEKKLLTPIKSKKNESKLVMPCIQSPAGPNAVRTSNFQMCGYVVFSLREVTRTQWTLNKLPYTSPLEGSISMKIQSDLQLDDEHRGFLTMFDDISGFGAWHRRWCLLSSHTLSYWKYPDDENKKIPIGTIDLRGVITENVGLVSRDICARLHTFLLETTRPRQEDDKDSLVLNIQGDKTRIRHLLSADGKPEMLTWCRKINTTLALLRAWRCNVAS